VNIETSLGIAALACSAFRDRGEPGEGNVAHRAPPRGSEQGRSGHAPQLKPERPLSRKWLWQTPAFSWLTVSKFCGSEFRDFGHPVFMPDLLDPVLIAACSLLLLALGAILLLIKVDLPSA
jgi:hypothetical protein